MRLSDVRAANKRWFDPGNKKFFRDKSYRLLKAKSGQYYLVQETSKWSDMFGSPKKYVFVLHLIDDNLKISPALDDEFDTLDDIKDFLKEK